MVLSSYWIDCFAGRGDYIDSVCRIQRMLPTDAACMYKKVEQRMK